MIALLVLFVCFSNALSDWLNEYNNDPRPHCPTDFDKPQINNRIVGGRDAGIGTFPYAVGIIMGSGYGDGYRTDNAFCGGTLITDSHVLTAAHCMIKYQSLKEFLRLNINDYDTRASDEVRNYVRRVKSIRLHPRYEDDTFDNDLATVTLDQPVPIQEGIRMAILPPLDRELDDGTICTVWGWGRTSYEGYRSHVMQKVDLPITSRDECQRYLSHNITENMICAGGKEGEDACLGDSGGSLLSRDGNVYCLAGIVSFGKRCALKDVSGVYTNVARFTDWIYEGTRNSACKPRILHQ